MNAVKRIVCTVLVLAILSCSLASCGVFKDDRSVIESAEEALKNEPYTVNIGILYESEDEGMRSAIEAFSYPVIKVLVNGEDFKMTMTTSSNGVEEQFSYTLADGALYAQYKSGADYTCTEIEYNEQTKADIESNLGAAAKINTDDFENTKVRTFGEVTILTSTEMKDETLEKLVADLQSDFDSLGASVDIKDASLTIQLTDGKYSISIFTCEYVITTDDGVYDLSMTFAAEFKYGGDVVITNPSNS